MEWRGDITTTATLGLKGEWEEEYALDVAGGLTLLSSF